MLAKITLSLMLCSILSLSAQDRILDSDDFLGKWTVRTKPNEPSKMYLIKFKSTENHPYYSSYPRRGMNFFIGRFTGKRKVKPFVEKIEKKDGPIRCGLSDEPKFKFVFGYHDIWTYDSNTRVLKVFTKPNGKNKKYKVEQISPTELVLIRVK